MGAHGGSMHQPTSAGEARRGDEPTPRELDHGLVVGRPRVEPRLRRDNRYVGIE